MSRVNWFGRLEMGVTMPDMWQDNVYSPGPGGFWIISPESKQLDLIKGPEDPHNMAWGDNDGKTLYIAALTGIYRNRMNIAGVRP